jgi:hypothetical protein
MGMKTKSFALCFQGWPMRLDVMALSRAFRVWCKLTVDPLPPIQKAGRKQQMWVFPVSKAVHNPQIFQKKSSSHETFRRFNSLSLKVGTCTVAPLFFTQLHISTLGSFKPSPDGLTGALHEFNKTVADRPPRA